jgi:hypothetical protein
MTRSETNPSRRPLRLPPLPHPEKTQSDREESREAGSEDDEGAWIHEWSVPETGRLTLDS